MLLFWLLAAVLAAGAAILVVAGAARAERTTATADPGLEVYRRQLGELDDLAERGLLGAAELKSARAEAGRRLIREADLSPAPADAPTAPTDLRRPRRFVLAAAVGAPALALLAYLAAGSPGLPDQPFKPRLAQWTRTASTNPGRLTVPELTAVLQDAASKHPTDPQGWVFLARFQLELGDTPSAVRSLQRAAALAPRDASIWARLGETLVVASKGDVPADAQQAFQQALAIDPTAPGPRYMLARARVVAGDAAGGLSEMKSVLGMIPASEPAHKALEDEIAYVSANGRLPPSQGGATAQAGPGADQAAFIQSMVDRLAARLKAQPDDPAGWARLIRAYGVLGQTAKRQAAVGEARRLFKDRPQDLKRALASAE